MSGGACVVARLQPGLLCHARDASPPQMRPPTALPRPPRIPWLWTTSLWTLKSRTSCARKASLRVCMPCCVRMAGSVQLNGLFPYSRIAGIKALFPIQAETLRPVLGGNDLVGRARTGCGKTLAFTLPIVQSCMSSVPTSGRRAAGRGPMAVGEACPWRTAVRPDVAGVRLTRATSLCVAVLAPTRELAKQVHEDFQYMGKAAGLTTVCVYGGSAYGPQESALR